MTAPPESLDPRFASPLPSSILRSCFWRCYDSLGTLTLLGLSASLLGYGALAGLTWAWPRVPGSLGRVALVLSVASVVSAGVAWIGRRVFSRFVSPVLPWRPVFSGGGLSDAARVLTLEGGTLLLGLWAFNNLLIYWRMAQNGAWIGWFLSAGATTLLGFLLLSSVWHLPLLFYREDPAWRVAWRSVLLLVSHPLESILLGALTTAGWVILGTVSIAQAGWIVGLPLFLALPCTTLEKILWNHKIVRREQTPTSVWDRWERESKRGWRELVRPWETH